MALMKWQAHVLDSSGNVQSGATVTVRRQSDNSLASIYVDNGAVTPKANPFTAGSDGLADFFSGGGVYKITATLGAFTRTWEYVSIGSSQSLDESDIQTLITDGVANVAKTGFTIILDNRGSVLSTGTKGNVRVPFNCTVTGWTLLADQTGSLVIDVWKDTYANFPPVVGDSIAGTEKPTLSSAAKNEDLALTTWAITLLEGDILRFNVDSVATIARADLSLHLTRT